MTLNTHAGFACALTLIPFSTALCGETADAPGVTCQLDIPSEDLQAALQAFALACHHKLLYRAQLVAGKTSHALSGRFTSKQAIRQMLDGTGLEFDITPASVVLIKGVNEGKTGSALDATSTSESDAYAPNQTGSANEASGLSEIIVTARKQDELVLQVPAPITAVTAQTIERTESVRLEDYLSLVPGATFNTVRAGQTDLSFRGINNGGANATVVVYVNNAPFTSSTNYANGALVTPDLDPSDIAQVEILRGPQGTLYGANAVGGVLKYVTVKPDAKDFSGRVEVNAESVAHGGFGGALRAAVNIPLVADTLALRISGYDRDDPGYIDIPNLHRRNVNEVHVNGGRAELLYTPSGELSFDLSATEHKTTSSATDTVHYNPFTVRPAFGDLNQESYLNDQFLNAQYWIYNFDVNWNSGWAKWVASTSYSTQLNGANTDATPQYGAYLSAALGRPNTGLDNPLIVHQHKFTEEVRLASDSDGPLDWQIGAFYTLERSTYEQSANLFDTTTQAYITDFGDAFVATLTAQYREYSGFANVDYHFNEKFDVSAGARYSEDSQQFHEFAEGFLIGATQDFDNPSQEHSVTWAVNPRYKISDSEIVYARVATGYRPGGGNDLTAALIEAGAPKSFKADHLIDYELGWKASLFDRSVTADLSIYYINWTDVQLPISLANFSYEGNGGTAHSEGIEAAITWQPIKHLNLALNVSYNNNRLVSDAQVNTALSQAGNRLPSTPRFQGGFNADFDWNLLSGTTAFVGGTLYATSARPNAFMVGYDPASATGTGSFSNYGLTTIYDPNTGAPAGEANTALPGYVTLSLRTGIEHGPWKVEAYVKNLTDVRAFSAYGGANNPSAANLSNVWGAVILRPRTVGISAAYKF